MLLKVLAPFWYDDACLALDADVRIGVAQRNFQVQAGDLCPVGVCITLEACCRIDHTAGSNVHELFALGKCNTSGFICSSL